MTEHMREDESKQPSRRHWPPGVQSISVDNLDTLGVDRNGNLYWDGKAVEMRHFVFTRGQTLLAALVTAAAILGGVGAAAQGWAAYHDWACRVGWPAGVTCPPHP